MKTLAILIPTVKSRAHLLKELEASLTEQIKEIGAFDFIRIFTDNSFLNTGTKRNNLNDLAQGYDYIWFIDDDDEIVNNGLIKVFNAIQTGVDALAISGYMTTNGTDRKDWFISKDLEYKADWINGKEVYLRPTNHITPMKQSIAAQIRFEDKSNFEDYDFCMKLKELGLIKTEFKIEEPIYHYRYQNYDKLY